MKVGELIKELARYDFDTEVKAGLVPKGTNEKVNVKWRLGSVYLGSVNERIPANKADRFILITVTPL